MALLSGSMAIDAAAAVDEIALALVQMDTTGRSDLLLGDAGLALFYTYLADRQPDAAHEITGARFLERAAAASDPAPNLQSALGVAWAISHLSDAVDEGEPDATAALLADRLPSWLGPHDLLNGLAGVGAYALARLPHPDAARCLAGVVDALADRAMTTDQGITWWTEPAWLEPAWRARYPDGCYDLGVAHGVPGVIGVLAGALKAGVAAERARALLAGAVAWLLAQRLPDDERSCFPSWSAPGSAPVPARTAWCYGDPGIAAVLLAAARAAAEPSWQREAIAVALAAARRAPEATGVVDAGLCHGAVGLGHLYQRLHAATGEPALGAAAVDWIARALAMRRPGEGVAGFVAHGVRAGRDAGLLTGAAGVGLALLAALGDDEPAWDAILLMS